MDRVFKLSLCLAIFASIFFSATSSNAQRSENWARCENAGGKYSLDEAIDACSAIIVSGSEANQSLSIAYDNRGITYVRRGDERKAAADYDRAIADYNEAIRLNPKDHFPYRNRGVAYWRKEDKDRARADLRRAAELGNPEAPDLLRRLDAGQ